MKRSTTLTTRWAGPAGLCFVLLVLGACTDDAKDDAGTGETGADQELGDTALVAIVNPVVNTGHNTGVPAEQGSERDGIPVNAEPGTDSPTANAGLAVVEVPVGVIEVLIGDAPALAHTVIAEGDVYDAAIAYDGSGAVLFENTPIRYAVGDGSEAIFYAPEDDLATINATLEQDDVIVVLGPGNYAGDITVKGSNVTLFGQGWSESAVTLDGSIVADGTDVRVRGLTITGSLTANGNLFGISFSVVHGPTDIKGNGGAFLRNTFCAGATVPSSNATLLDNYGIEPIPTPLEGVCP